MRSPAQPSPGLRRGPERSPARRQCAALALLIALASCGDNLRPELRAVARHAGPLVGVDETGAVLTAGGEWLRGVWRLGDSDAWEAIPNTLGLVPWGLGYDLDGVPLLLAAPTDLGAYLYRITKGARGDPIGPLLWVRGSDPVASPSGHRYVSVQGAPYRLRAGVMWQAATDLGDVQIETSIGGPDGTLFLVGSPGIVRMSVVGGDDVITTVVPAERLPSASFPVVLSGIDTSGALYFAHRRTLFAVRSDGTVQPVAAASGDGYMIRAVTTSTGATIVLDLQLGLDPERTPRHLLYRASGSATFEEVGGEARPVPTDPYRDDLVFVPPDRVLVRQDDWLGEIVIP